MRQPPYPTLTILPQLLPCTCHQGYYTCNKFINHSTKAKIKNSTQAPSNTVNTLCGIGGSKLLRCVQGVLTAAENACMKIIHTHESLGLLYHHDSTKVEAARSPQVELLDSLQMTHGRRHPHQHVVGCINPLDALQTTHAGRQLAQTVCGDVQLCKAGQFTNVVWQAF